MVDTSRESIPVLKSTAYTALTDRLRQRDGHLIYHQTLKDHKLMLERSLRQCRDNGWTTDELREPDALEWVASDVANRIQQAGRVYYYWDYLRVAYDDIGEPGVLVDNVRRQLPFDAAADDGGAAGGTDGALSDPTDAQASPTPRRSPWAVSDDHETGEAATLQAGLDVSDDQWLSPVDAAAGTALQQPLARPNFQPQIDAAVQQMAWI